MELSEEQESLVSQFYEISGLEPGSEDNKIKDLLAINDWNLSNAISYYFDSGFEVNTSVSSNRFSNTTAFSEHEAETNLTHRHEDLRPSINLQNDMFADNYLPKLPRAGPISNQWQFDLGIHRSKMDKGYVPHEISHQNHQDQNRKASPLWIVLLFIPKTLVTVILSILKFFFGGLYNKDMSFRNFPRTFDYESYILNEDKESACTQENENDKNEKSFNEIHSLVQKKFKWLLIVLIDSSEESSRFISSFKSHQSFESLQDTEIYIKDVQKCPEAHEVGVVYNAKKVPYVVLCANVTNNPSSMASMSIAYKSNVGVSSLQTEESTANTVSKVFRGLNRVFNQYNPQLISQRIDQQEIEFARLIKDQQDAAYVESLAKDKQKKQEMQKLQEMQQISLEKAAQRENFLLSQISLFDASKGESDPKSLVKLAIKLPGGQRIIESFSKNSTLNDIYFFVQLKLYINDLISDANNDFKDENDIFVQSQNVNSDLSLEKFIELFPFKFELFQPFPRKVIQHGKINITELKELKSGANLLVEFVDDDSDEE